MRRQVTLDSSPGNAPSILARKTTHVSPWVKLVEKSVRARPDAEPEAWHALALPDYVAIVATTPNGRIPIVRQFRPAVETHTWELPAGLVEAGETPESTCRRELFEETGLVATDVRCVGISYPDTGRHANRQHNFLVSTAPPGDVGSLEPDLEVALVDLPTLRSMIADGRFAHALHLAALLAAGVDAWTLGTR